ncbi:MAG: hypothetical protein V3R75_05340, partial [Alphaproteobacteria bacterium]
MHIKTILAGAALALAATIGSASAAERFSTLDGVTAVAMSAGELGAVVGGARHFQVSANGVLVDPSASTDADPLAPFGGVDTFFRVGGALDPLAPGFNG